MTKIASQITSLTVVYSTVYSEADQRKHQSSASLAFVWGIHRDRWIPRTKGQLRGKCFHLMTSSWCLLGCVVLAFLVLSSLSLGLCHLISCLISTRAIWWLIMGQWSIWAKRPGVWVNKPISLFSRFFTNTKRLVTYWISHYLLVILACH